MCHNTTCENGEHIPGEDALSSIFRQVEAGEPVIITRAGKPVARIVPIETQKRSGAGIDRGLDFIADDFDSALPPEVVDAFYR